MAADGRADASHTTPTCPPFSRTPAPHCTKHSVAIATPHDPTMLSLNLVSTYDQPEWLTLIMVTPKPYPVPSPATSYHDRYLYDLWHCQQSPYCFYTPRTLSYSSKPVVYGHC